MKKGLLKLIGWILFLVLAMTVMSVYEVYSPISKSNLQREESRKLQTLMDNLIELKTKSCDAKVLQDHKTTIID